MEWNVWTYYWLLKLMRSKLLTTSNRTLVFRFTTLECNICKHKPSCKFVKNSPFKNIYRYTVTINIFQFWYKLLDNESSFVSNASKWNQVLFTYISFNKKLTSWTRTCTTKRLVINEKKILFILIHVQALLTTMNNDYSHLEFNKVCNKHEGG